jgi:hypothetical protein
MTNPDCPHGRRGRTAEPGSGRVSAGQLLLALRRRAIACSIDSLSPNGWTARLGEPGKGPYAQQGHFPTRAAAAEWLLEEAERCGAVAAIAD